MKVAIDYCIGWALIMYGEGDTCITDYAYNDTTEALVKRAQAIADAYC